MLKQRLRIMYQGNVISKEVLGFAEYTVDVLKEQLPEVGDEKAKMFTTHIAMAAQRISGGEIVEDLDDLMWQEVMASEHFQDAKDFYEKIILRSAIDFPESEMKYLILHICNMLNEN